MYRRLSSLFLFLLAFRFDGDLILRYDCIVCYLCQFYAMSQLF